MRVQLEEKFHLEHTATMLDAAAAIKAHNSLQLWEEATNWQAQLNAVLGIGLGNMDTRNAVQEHIAGIQAELGRVERDVIRLGIQQEAKLERAEKEILGLQVQHAISASHIENALKEIVELQAQFLELNMGICLQTWKL